MHWYKICTLTKRLTLHIVDVQQKLTKEVQTALAQANKVAEETISAMRTVRSFANEDQEADSYYSKLQEMFILNKKQAVAYACFMWSSYVCTESWRFNKAFSLCSYKILCYTVTFASCIHSISQFLPHLKYFRCSSPCLHWFFFFISIFFRSLS